MTTTKCIGNYIKKRYDNMGDKTCIAKLACHIAAKHFDEYIQSLRVPFMMLSVF